MPKSERMFDIVACSKDKGTRKPVERFTPVTSEPKKLLSKPSTTPKEGLERNIEDFGAVYDPVLIIMMLRYAWVLYNTAATWVHKCDGGLEADSLRKIV